jgi:membrane protease YdiL (CAAX protease family)
VTDMLVTTPVRPARFFLATYALSWAIWTPLVLSRYSVLPIGIPEGTSTLLGLLGVLMPAACAIGLTGLAGGWQSVSVLLRRLAIWRVGLRWWAAVIVVQPILLLLSAQIYNLFGPATPVTPVPFASLSAFMMAAIGLSIAATGEEIGWRGVALPGLQMRSSSLVSSVILGLLWAGWHIPIGYSAGRSSSLVPASLW